MIISLKEDLVIKQDDKKIILEKGDKIQIIKEDTKELIKREGEKEWMRIKRDLDGLLRSNSPGELNKRLEDYFLETPYFSKGRFVNTDGLDQFQMMFLKRSEDSSLRFRFKKNKASESNLAVHLDVKTKKITKVYFSYQDNDVAKTDFKNSRVYVDVPSNDETVKNLIDYYIETKTLSKTDFVVNKKKYQEGKTMKNSLYESVLQAITELDINDASAEDFLRIGISAEEGAINLYNRIAKELEKRSEKGLFELFKSIAQEEKVHVGEFQGYLEKTDHEEKYSSSMGRDEAEEIMELDLLEDLVINQKDKRIILEKGDRIKIIESLYLERDDNWLVSRKFDFIKFDPKRATARIYIDDITFFQIDLIYIYSDEFEVYDDIPEQTFYRLTLGQKTPIGGGLTLKSNFNAYLGNLFSEDGQELFDLINRYIIKNRKIIGKLGQQHEDEISDYFRRKGPIDATDHYEGKGIL